MVKPEFKPFNFNVDSANKFSVISKNKEIIDFTGSTMSVGYNFFEPESIKPAVSKLVFNNIYTEKLTEKLLNLSGFENVAYTTSGTEACDTALSRFGKPIYALEGSYHGLTYITRLVSNGSGYDDENKIIHLKVPSLNFSVSRAIEYNDKLISDSKIPKGGTLIFELIQSDGGVNILTKSFINYVMGIAENKDLKVIVDEVYTGYGRSGEMLLFKKYGINPDMVCLGKGMAAGLPLGAVLYNGKWELPYNNVLNMQAANMFVSSIANMVIEAITENILEKVRKNGENILSKFQSIKSGSIYSSRGMGYMIGIELTNKKGEPDGNTALKIRDKLFENGVALSLTGEFNNVLKITPPILIDDSTLNDGINIITEVLLNKGIGGENVVKK